MRNVLAALGRDIKRLATTPATWAVLLFLTVLPSLYAWLNIYAFWDPYGNTGNLRVCVVNQDKGTDSPLLGQLDLGDQVVGALQENHQLGWDFVTYDDAMAELQGGACYGAFVIPEDFSAKVATIATGEFEQPTITYYVDEKSGPISPKITDTGANQLDKTINDTFFSTVSATIAQTVDQKQHESAEKLDGAEASAAAKVQASLADVREARAVIGSLNEAMTGLRDDIDETGDLLGQARAALGDTSESLEDNSQKASEANAAMTRTWGDALSAFDRLAPMATEAEAQMNAQVGAIQTALQRASDVAGSLNVPSQDWQKLVSALAQAVQASGSLTSDAHGKLEAIFGEVAAYRASVSEDTVPVLGTTMETISQATGQLSGSATVQQSLIQQLVLELQQVETLLGDNGSALQQVDSILGGIEEELESVAADIGALQASNALRELQEDHLDPQAVAAFMESPTRIQTEVLYPVNSFGSAMAPLFINLTLWIGVFMLMVVMRLEIDDEGLRRFTAGQRYLARFLLLAIIAVAQAVVCCAGCMALGTQVSSVPLFFASAMASALAYLAIQYALSVTLQYVGKALCVIMVFVQIPGATGLYPIELTPPFFHAIYPWFPFTYSIGALRETICGFYDGLWGHDIAMLVLFLAIFTAFGMAVRPRLANFNRMCAHQAQDSGLLNGESVQLPLHRYRAEQLVLLLAESESFRAQTGKRLSRFIERYPSLRQGALLVGLVGIAAVTMVLAALQVDKAIILTVWLVWFVAMVGIFLGAEYFRDYLMHLKSLGTMSRDEVRRLAVSEAVAEEGKGGE